MLTETNLQFENSNLVISKEKSTAKLKEAMLVADINGAIDPKGENLISSEIAFLIAQRLIRHHYEKLGFNEKELDPFENPVPKIFGTNPYYTHQEEAANKENGVKAEKTPAHGFLTMINRLIKLEDDQKDPNVIADSNYKRLPKEILEREFKIYYESLGENERNELLNYITNIRRLEEEKTENGQKRKDGKKSAGHIFQVHSDDKPYNWLRKAMPFLNDTEISNQDLEKVIEHLPPFVLTRYPIIKSGESFTDEGLVVNCPYVPALVNGRLHPTMKAETITWSTAFSRLFLAGNDKNHGAIGLAGMTASQTKEGRVTKYQLDFIEYVYQLAFGKDTERSFSSTTGHPGTVASILLTLNQEKIDNLNKDKPQTIGIYGAAGNIGGATTYSFIEKKRSDDENEDTVYLLDTNIKNLEEIVKRANLLAEQNKKKIIFIGVPTKEDSINEQMLENLSDISKWVLCVSSIKSLVENQSFIEILNRSGEKGIKPLLVDDGWPPAINSSQLAEKMNGNFIRTEVGISKDIGRKLNEEENHLMGNNDRLGKPIVEDGYIYYGCELESKMYDLLNTLRVNSQGSYEYLAVKISEISGMNIGDTVMVMERFTTCGFNGKAEPKEVMFMYGLFLALGYNVKFHDNGQLIN